MEYYTIFDADIPVQYEVDADIPVQYEVDDEMAKCCIYTVPEFIKKGKEECYQPYVISIGPIFYKDSKLEAMQEQKLIYLKCFLEDPDNVYQSVEHYKYFVRMNESKIRKCYQKQISIPSEEFIHMIVVDAAFLIYLFCKPWKTTSSTQTELRTVSDKLMSLKKYVREDVLYVEENQLPFFVLTGMYNIAYSESNLLPPPFINVALKYIGRYHHFLKEKDVDRIITNIEILLPYASRIEHLLDLQRECCLTTTGLEKVPEKESRHQIYYPKIPKARELSAAGVKFEVNESNDSCDIKFDKSSGVLKMPQLRLLHRSSEAFFRGILFFEQCSYHKRKYITDHCTFLDALIDTVEDIQVLQHKKIFENYLASDQDAVDLFNKLAQNAFFTSNYSFYDVCEGLNDYTSDRWNRWKAILWKDYLNHPWAFISVVYLAILLFLTLLQTISGFSSK